MAVPNDLKNTTTRHSVFMYCKTLQGQANDLAGVLKEPQYWDISVQADINKAAKYMAPIVWLVGHGLSNQSAMLNDAGSVVVAMSAIVAWCNAYGAKHVIDTACYPSARCTYMKTQKLKFSYYCKKVDAVAKSLGDYQKSHPPKLTDLDSWWDGEQITQFV